MVRDDAVTYAEGTRDAHGFRKTFPGAAARQNASMIVTSVSKTA